MSITIRLRSLVWFATGVLVALLTVWVVMSAWSAEAAPGDDDSTFVPVSPCRVLDQRETTPLGPGQVVTQQITGTNRDCTIPADAVAVSMNVTITRPSAWSYLTVFEADRDGPPEASNLNWTPSSSPTPNKVDVKLSDDGAIKLYNDAGQVSVIADIVGYYTDRSLTDLVQRVAVLEAQVAASQPVQVENRLAAVEAKTDPMAVETVDGQPTVRFTGVNVQVVDGSGDTDGQVNGRGNLIVGYNRDINDNDTRTGSHNLIVGDDHTYDSYGGFLAGLNNRVSGAWASVSGGGGNIALADYSSVAGGENNTSSALFAAIAGGIDNGATGEHSAVLGGDRNTASGSQATVAGGGGNIASGGESAVAGGNVNEAAAGNTTVTGGRNNLATGSYSSISGGDANAASGPFSAVTGGFDNVASGGSSTVSGGRKNLSSGSYSTVVGGRLNWSTGDSAAILGGAANTAEGFGSTVSGGGFFNNENRSGLANESTGELSSIAGGYNNVASGDYEAVAGGGGVVCDSTSVIVCGDGENGAL